MVDTNFPPLDQGSGELVETRRNRWVPWLVLAIPLLCGIAALRGLTVALPMFHGSDELNFHYPTILRFSHQLPFPDLANYKAAQTPLFHLLMAYVGKLTGYQLWRLRLVEALLSYLLALAVFRLLRRRLGMGVLQATALALLFELSPYVFGASFRLMTDNLAMLFSVVAIDQLEGFRESRRLAPFLLGCVCAGAALLTRQSAAFLFAVAGLYAIGVGGLSRRARIVALCAVGLAFVPAGLLFLTWHGLVPPSGGKNSCGLCSGASGVGGTGLRLATVELTLAVIGLYGAVLFAPAFPWRDRAAIRALLPGAVVAAGAGALLLLLFPARPDIHPVGATTTAGVLWKAAQHTPLVLGTPLLLWLLVPLAGAVLWWRFTLAPRRWPMLVLLGCFLLGALAIRLSWQKYVDPYALLVLLISARPRELDSPKRLGGAAVLAAAYLAYMLSFV